MANRVVPREIPLVPDRDERFFVSIFKKNGYWPISGDLAKYRMP